MLKSLLVVSSFLFFVTSLVAQDNLIKNGHFAEGTKNWNVLLLDKSQPIKAHIEHADSYKEYGLADNFVGTNFVELDQKSAIEQTILTRKGESYTLLFAYAHRPNAGTKQLIVTAGNRAIYTKTIKNTEAAGNFTYKHVTFIATENETKIGFHSVSILGGAEDMGILLTDVLCNFTSEVDLDRFVSDKKF
ncbi:DUF642 domain-containing protein [Aureispira anguillae]|uniref:DUF642 domain-containing protein n=1 Tax=Aureispira anguillae TaxID=2864201 RepID=A0A915VKI7_9BACT|nr:DUF642 domain-containing protein [Aureispira anguillae]BDS09727.1 DUF642 domain-containing protein [Aureispira anguillae]